MERIPMTKPGRNDPCPCGSGKKFKQCCWQNTLPKKKKHTVRVLPSTGNTPRPFGKIMSPPSQEVEEEVHETKNHQANEKA
jgi:hypothetical protein